MQIGIGSGHKQSVVLVYDDGKPLCPDGQGLVVGTGPSLNLHCLVEAKEEKTIKAMAKRLGGILRGVLRGIPRRRRPAAYTAADRLVLSLPGVSTDHDLEIGRKCVEASGMWPAAAVTNALVVDDTYAGLISGARSTRGLCAISGTGASVYVGTPDGRHRQFKPEKLYKFDGYGAMLGDHGSGFRLAMRTLEQICRDYDKLGYFNPNQDTTGAYALLGAVAEKMNEVTGNRGQNYFSRFQNWFDLQMANRNPDWRFTIADLATVVTAAADAGNGYARNRVDEAAQGMAQTIRVALQEPHFVNMEGVKIYCHGGMFRHSKYYFEQVQTHLVQHHSNPLELARYRPCVGALLIAASANWTAPDAEDIHAIERAIATLPADKQGLVLNAPLTPTSGGAA